MNTSILDELINRSELTKARIAGLCGMSRVTLDGVLQGKDVKISTIESICKVLGVNPSILFDDNAANSVVNSPHAIAAGHDAQLIHNEASIHEAELLQKLCDEKDERIKELKEIIQILKEK